MTHATHPLQQEVIRLALIAAHPKLVAASEVGAYVAPSVVAKNIRTELKAAFPGVKFSVTSTPRGTLDVNWTDGPTQRAVDVLVQKYSAGTFDGMTDSYEYSRDDWNDVFGSVRYIFTNRDYSDAKIVAAIQAVASEFGGAPVTLADYNDGNFWNYQWKRELRAHLQEN